jgi:glycosyltransferase involved in cell wall biosynthesis
MIIDLSIVVPCFNEESNLDELIDRLRRTFDSAKIRGEIVLVDDGSSDGTWPAIERLASAFPAIVGQHHPRNRGIERGWGTGVSSATGALVCFIDADLQNHPEDVSRLYDRFVEGGIEIVQGRRIPADGVRGARYLLSRGLNTLLNLVFGMRLSDNKSGFILAKRSTVAHILEHRFRYRYYQALLLVSAHAKGYRIAEIDTQFGRRTGGRSFMSGAVPVKVIWGCLVDIAKGFIEFRILKPRGSDAPGTSP